MPYRKTQLATGHFYHIYSRSINAIPIFAHLSSKKRLINLISYYAIENPPMKFSYFQLLKPPERSRYLKQLATKELLVTIHAFVIMADHFHFLIQQSKEEGIRIFMQKLLNSFSHFYNIKHKRKGPLFEGNFQAILVEDDNYLIHLTRYIHLNPVTAYIVDDPANYSYSSYNIYLGKQKNFPPIKTQTILSYFNNIQDFQKFHLEHRYEQRLTAKIRKELLIDFS